MQQVNHISLYLCNLFFKFIPMHSFFLFYDKIFLLIKFQLKSQNSSCFLLLKERKKKKFVLHFIATHFPMILYGENALWVMTILSHALSNTNMI